MFIGPFPATAEKESRKKILTCNPGSGRACVEQIVTRSGAARVPPAADAARDRFAAALRRPATARRSVCRAGHPARHPGDARVAEFPVPHRARSRPARSRRSCTRCRRSSSPRASAISSGARCRTTELLALAESGKLADPRVLEAQVDRMLADPARVRRLPRTSPASGSRRATSTSSSRIPTSSRNGIPSCARR